MLETIVNTLNAVGKPTELYQSPDGTRVLILPHGGRILGLFTSSNSQNFYWTHPALSSLETARSFYESGEWHNSGGDRTWLSPEVDVFFPNFPNLEKYWQPRQLDPGNYDLSIEGGSPRLVNRAKLVFSRLKHEVDLKISKSVAPALNPLRYEPGPWRLEAEYAGYTLRTTLELIEAGTAPPAQVGLWNLVQLPHGGDFLVPTYFRSEPKVYFGVIPPEALAIGDHLIRYRMRDRGEYKIGIRAVATPGRAGYLYSVNNQSALVIRNFSVNPSGEYVDVPLTETADLGYSVQACTIKSALGSFSELEYHCPAIGKGTGRFRCEDESQIWAFRGRRSTIEEVARKLLSPEI